jgi:hypothetical protein
MQRADARKSRKVIIGVSIAYTDQRHYRVVVPLQVQFVQLESVGEMALRECGRLKAGAHPLSVSWAVDWGVHKPREAARLTVLH